MSTPGVQSACLDGAIVPLADARIPVTDAGLLRGDGVFEVMRLYDGRPFAREQHLALVRMRAAENHRWILRATNDGITATIDSAGRLRGTVPMFTEATSITGFSYIADQTVYTRWGDWFPLLCAVIAVTCLIAERVV